MKKKKNPKEMERWGIIVCISKTTEVKEISMQTESTFSIVIKPKTRRNERTSFLHVRVLGFTYKHKS